MEFIKTLIKNRRLVFQLGKNDFKNKFASTSLGAIWGFVQPFIFMLTYVMVFQYILKVGNSGNDPYIVWYFPGMTMWMFLNDSILNASNSIRNYSYLVKKVVFPVDVIPVISIISSSIVSIFLFIITVAICLIFGYVLNIFMFIYFVISALLFIVAFTRLTSAICTLVPDFSQLLSVIMQLMFWFTPILWNISMISGVKGGLLLHIVKCMPFSYLVTGFRQVFLGGNIITESYGIYTLVFWLVTLLIFLWGNSVFKRSKKEFSDVL